MSLSRPETSDSEISLLDVEHHSPDSSQDQSSKLQAILHRQPSSLTFNHHPSTIRPPASHQSLKGPEGTHKKPEVSKEEPEGEHLSKTDVFPPQGTTVFTLLNKQELSTLNTPQQCVLAVPDVPRLNLSTRHTDPCGSADVRLEPAQIALEPPVANVLQLGTVTTPRRVETQPRSHVQRFTPYVSLSNHLSTSQQPSSTGVIKQHLTHLDRHASMHTGTANSGLHASYPAQYLHESRNHSQTPMKQVFTSQQENLSAQPTSPLADNRPGLVKQRQHLQENNQEHLQANISGGSIHTSPNFFRETLDYPLETLSTRNSSHADDNSKTTSLSLISDEIYDGLPSAVLDNTSIEPPNITSIELGNASTVTSVELGASSARITTDNRSKDVNHDESSAVEISQNLEPVTQPSLVVMAYPNVVAQLDFSILPIDCVLPPLPLPEGSAQNLLYSIAPAMETQTYNRPVISLNSFSNCVALDSSQIRCDQVMPDAGIVGTVSESQTEFSGHDSPVSEQSLTPTSPTLKLKSRLSLGGYQCSSSPVLSPSLEERRKRYLRTRSALEKSGLMGITRRTSKLLKENQSLGNDIEKLKLQTAQLFEEVFNNEENKALLRSIV